MDLDGLPGRVRERIETDCGDAANTVGHGSRGGGCLLPTMDGCELAQEIAAERDPGSERGRDELAAEFTEAPWVHQDPCSATREEVWTWSRAEFVRLATHRVRFPPFPAGTQDRGRF